MRYWRRRLKVNIFEFGLALYAIYNGFLTFHQDSLVFESLWNLIGSVSIVAVLMQVVAGLFVAAGLAVRRANLEGAGLCLVSSSFIIRAFVLLTGGEITVADLNTAGLALIICYVTTVRILTILRDHDVPT